MLQVIHNVFYCVNYIKKYNVLQVIRDKAQNAPGDSQGIRVGNLWRVQQKVQRVPGDSQGIYCVVKTRIIRKLWFRWLIMYSK